MISRMKKLTFLVYHKEYETFLQRLRDLGVVHVVERQTGEMDSRLTEFLQKRALYKQIQAGMQARASEVDAARSAVDSKESAESLVKTYEQLLARGQELQQQLPAIGKEMEQLEPWGEFDTRRIQELEQAGWYMQFYVCTAKEYDETWEKEYGAVRISEEGARIYFVTVTHEPAHLDIEPVRLPALSWQQLADKKHGVEEEIARTETELNRFCQAHVARMAQCCAELDSEIDLLKVKLNSAPMAEGTVMVLEGWIPEENETQVRAMLEQEGIYYEIRQATREDAAPVKFKNNAFVRMYEVLTKMYGMPSGTDFDPTPILAPFFSLFFAFCMGDAGYGLILILLGFYLKKKMSANLAGMMNLVITLGVFTTVFGAILGTFFGMSLLQSDLPEQIKQFIIAGNVELFGSTYDKQMVLALGIGVVHISIAMTVKAINSTVFYGFKESLSAWGWWLLVVGSVVVGTLTFLSVIPAEISKWAFISVGGVAAVGIYLLNNLHRNVLVNVGAGLWDTYNMASGLLGDVLSYIRLFALGLAGGMLGQTFNNLALMVVDGREGIGLVFGWIGFGLIILVGHTLNIAMSCLSAFVHPLRLTFVEYFKNAGYEGKGVEYKPFKK